MTNKLPGMRKAPTEHQLWQRIKPTLEQGESRVYRVETTTMGGFPDIVWCPYMRGPKFLELKAGRLVFRPAQRVIFDQMDRAGCSTFVVWQKVQRGEIRVYDAITLMNWEGVAESFDFDEWVEEQLK